MLELFIILAIISLIKNILLIKNIPFIVSDFIKNICYANVYRLLIRYIVYKDAFIIMFGPMIISDLTLSILYLYLRNNRYKIDLIVKLIILDLLKLIIISIILYLNV